MVEPVFLHSPPGDARLLAGGSGDGRGAGVGLQAAGVGETASVVSDLGQHPGAELDAEAGEAEDDFSVRVLRESLLHCLREVVGCCAGGFQLAQEGEHLLAERVLDQRRLVGPLAAEDLADPVGLGLDAALAAGSLEGGLDLRAAQLLGAGGRGGVGASLSSSRASGRQRPFCQVAKASRADG